MRCFLISVLLVAGATGTAIADRKLSDAANAELERGEASFRAKDYAAAIKAFDAGYAIDPQPIFLYDKAQAQRLAGDCKSAIDTYKQFLATEPPANEATRAKKNLENCQTTLPPPVEVAPAPAREEPQKAAEPEPEPAREPPPPSHTETSRWWRDSVGMSLLTTGVIGLGIGAGFAVAARAAASDTALATNVDQWTVARDRWERDRIVAGVALGAGATCVVLGVLRLSLHERSVTVTPARGNGAVVTLGGVW
ncbi:MAG TPA: hypothetical protein VFV99_25250 [Kofleriaceae bacterium]|nr:hypothetical protein [Kofleriaceae bacterium]